MPRYFVDTFDTLTCRDQDGTDLPDLAALTDLMRSTLIRIALDESAKGQTRFRAQARDEQGRAVMAMTVDIAVRDLSEGQFSGADDTQELCPVEAH